MAAYLLDTNILSDLIRNPKGVVAARLRHLDQSELATSIVVAAELYYGAERVGSARLTERIDQLLRKLPVLPFEAPAERVYGQLRARLERAGIGLGSNDLFIAAHALSLERTLVTDNVREFSRAFDLTVENWLR